MSGQPTVDIDTSADDSALNGSSDSRKLSPGKMLFLALLAALVLGGSAFGAYLYIKDRFSFGDGQQTSKGQRKWAAAPDDIGRFKPQAVEKEAPPETPATPAEAESPPVPELPDFAPPPMAQTVAVEGEPPETLRSRR